MSQQENQNQNQNQNQKQEKQEGEGGEEQKQKQQEDFTTREEADAGRLVALQLFNKGQYEGALEIQSRVLDFFTKTFGEVALDCGLPYLDYGVTLLAIIQSMSAEDAALAGNAGNEELEEDLAICYENLDCARVCYQKGISGLEKKIAAVVEGKKEKDEEKKDLEEQLAAVELRLAEVHDTLGEFFMEQDDEESAINSYKSALELREKHLSENHRLVLALHVSIGKAYYRLQIYEEAVKCFETALELASGGGGGGEGEGENKKAALDEELINEIRDSLEDAKEMVERGGLAEVREEVEQMFPKDEETEVQMQEAEKMVKNNKNFGEVPTEGQGEDSLQLAADVMIPFLPTDASNSVSHFPSQGHSMQQKPTTTNTSSTSTSAAAASGDSKNQNQNQNQNQNNNSTTTTTSASGKNLTVVNTNVNKNVVVRRKPAAAATAGLGSSPANQTSEAVSEKSGSRRNRDGDEGVGMNVPERSNNN